MEQIDLKSLNLSIIQLSKAVESIKEELGDRFLTGDEIENIRLAEDELEKGETISLGDLKTELG